MRPEDEGRRPKTLTDLRGMRFSHHFDGRSPSGIPEYEGKIG
ncbi:hypothetical protein HMPREF9440_01287 [Sutterella parvirubra YIT 11816]|uniref:Uncharacterized protein n=1 Tax=Sutterella parvirubra YIT 11816 TaxID=762967 RepID=H3KEX2_9BURK|nr:hypothetical protein HMPREF9440_01287 [Sutterella parvirubra YIT 11816]